MREKIAEVFDGLTENRWMEFTAQNHSRFALTLADQILSLPVDEVITLGDLLRMWENGILTITVDETNPASIADACSDGELPERRRKMRETLEKAKNLTAQITQSHIASIGSFGNTYVAQIDREAIDSLSKLINDALKGD
jgi:hypothetical protein